MSSTCPQSKGDIQQQIYIIWIVDCLIAVQV